MNRLDLPSGFELKTIYLSPMKKLVIGQFDNFLKLPLRNDEKQEKFDPDVTEKTPSTCRYARPHGNISIAD